MVRIKNDKYECLSFFVFLSKGDYDISHHVPPRPLPLRPSQLEDEALREAAVEAFFPKKNKSCFDYGKLLYVHVPINGIYLACK